MRFSVFGISTSQRGNGADGLCNGFRFANTAGFNDDIVEALAFHQLEKLFYQVGFQGAADATVLKRYQAIVFLVYNATFLNQVGIDVYFAQIVYNNGKLDASFIG